MPVLDTQHKRKSVVITLIILLSIFYAVFNFGMKYLDPPVEYGVAINFGNSDIGSGKPVENTKLASQQKQEVVEKNTELSSKKILSENVITDNSIKDAPVIKKSKENKSDSKSEKTDRKTTKVAEKVKSKPKPSKSTTAALNSLLNGNVDKGEGDDSKSGVKGKQNGDPSSSKYYENTGKGSGGNYNLAGRTATSKPTKQPNCEEEGTVVVSIFVNQNGKVVKAIPGARGTTNSAPCLYKAAKDAALATKWNEDGNAPNQQKGTIIYKFSLSK